MSGWSISQAALQLSTYTQLTFSCFWTLSFLAASMAKSVLTYAIVLFCACFGFFFFSKYGIIGEGNGNPIQYSCLENPMDRGTWWAAVYGVAQSRHNWSDLAAAAEYIMRNAGLEEAQARIKIARRNINNLRYADHTTIMALSLSKE